MNVISIPLKLKLPLYFSGGKLDLGIKVRCSEGSSYIQI